MTLDEFNKAAPTPRRGGNTVMGRSEAEFRQAWIHMLSAAMMRTGNGFRMDSPKRNAKKGASGWHGERRADKIGTTKLERRLLTGAR